MTWHKIDFNVPLSGSYLFDMHAKALANEICAKFPGLETTFNYNNDDKIHIFGKLNDYWYEEFQKTVFNNFATRLSTETENV